MQHGWVLGTAMRILCMFSEWDGRPADETGLAVQFMVLRFSMLGLCGWRLTRIIPCFLCGAESSVIPSITSKIRN